MVLIQGFLFSLHHEPQIHPIQTIMVYSSPTPNGVIANQRNII